MTDDDDDQFTPKKWSMICLVDLVLLQTDQMDDEIDEILNCEY